MNHESDLEQSIEPNEIKAALVDISPPALWDRQNGFVENLFVHAENPELAGNCRALLPLVSWTEKIAANNVSEYAGNGVLIRAEEDIETLLPFLQEIAVIALELPSYADGRAYSKAARLKQRYNYQGEVRAVGDVLIDQISNLLRAGFDTLEITHPLTKQRLDEGNIHNFPGFYQPGAGLEMRAGRRAWRQM